jgi:hypothetical protein
MPSCPRAWYSVLSSRTNPKPRSPEFSEHLTNTSTPHAGSSTTLSAYLLGFLASSNYTPLRFDWRFFSHFIHPEPLRQPRKGATCGSSKRAKSWKCLISCDFSDKCPFPPPSPRSTTSCRSASAAPAGAKGPQVVGPHAQPQPSVPGCRIAPGLHQCLQFVPQTDRAFVRDGDNRVCLGQKRKEASIAERLDRRSIPIPGNPALSEAGGHHSRTTGLRRFIRY